jgi:hypothetical protein
VSVVDDEIQTHSLDSQYTQIPIGKGQNKEVSQSAHVPIATFRSNQSSGLTCWVCSHAIKVPLLLHKSSCTFELIARAKPLKKTNAFTFRLVAKYFDPFTFSWDSCQSTKAGTKAIRKMIATTSKSINALLCCGKSITSFDSEPVSTFQLVVASSAGNDFIHKPTFQFIVESKQNANLQTTNNF